MTDIEIQQETGYLWNLFRKEGFTNPVSVIEQISYIILIRMLDEQEAREEKYYQDLCNKKVFRSLAFLAIEDQYLEPINNTCAGKGSECWMLTRCFQSFGMRSSPT